MVETHGRKIRNKVRSGQKLSPLLTFVWCLEPKNEQIRPQVPVAPQTKSLVPPTSLELETSGILSRNGTEEKNHRIPSVQTPGTATPSASEVQQLKGIIKGCIHNRSQQPNNVPLTIGELSAEIKNKTQHSWGGYWGVRHGPLASFIKAHKDVFSLIKNKYVVLAGTENEANIPEPRKLEQTVPVPAPAQAQAPQHTGPPRGVPLNVLVSPKSMTNISVLNSILIKRPSTNRHSNSNNKSSSSSITRMTITRC